MKEKADAPEKKERHQVGVIRASRAMNQSNYMASHEGSASLTVAPLIGEHPNWHGATNSTG